MKITKNKEIYFNFINEWHQFFFPKEYNWKNYHFTLLEFEVEDDGKMTGGVELTVILVGIGFRVRYAWDFEGSEVGKVVENFVEEESKKSDSILEKLK